MHNYREIKIKQDISFLKGAQINNNTFSSFGYTVPSQKYAHPFLLEV